MVELSYRSYLIRMKAISERYFSNPIHLERLRKLWVSLSATNIVNSHQHHYIHIINHMSTKCIFLCFLLHQPLIQANTLQLIQLNKMSLLLPTKPHPRVDELLNNCTQLLLLQQFLYRISILQTNKKPSSF